MTAIANNKPHLATACEIVNSVLYSYLSDIWHRTETTTQTASAIGYATVCAIQLDQTIQECFAPGLFSLLRDNNDDESDDSEDDEEDGEGVSPLHLNDNNTTIGTRSITNRACLHHELSLSIYKASKETLRDYFSNLVLGFFIQ